MFFFSVRYHSYIISGIFESLIDHDAHDGGLVELGLEVFIGSSGGK